MKVWHCLDRDGIYQRRRWKVQTKIKYTSNNSDNLQANLNLKLFECDYISWESSPEMSMNKWLFFSFFSFVFFFASNSRSKCLIGFCYFFAVLDCHAFVCVSVKCRRFHTHCALSLNEHWTWSLEFGFVLREHTRQFNVQRNRIADCRKAWDCCAARKSIFE